MKKHSKKLEKKEQLKFWKRKKKLVKQMSARTRGQSSKLFGSKGIRETEGMNKRKLKNI